MDCEMEERRSEGSGVSPEFYIWTLEKRIEGMQEQEMQ